MPIIFYLEHFFKFSLLKKILTFVLRNGFICLVLSDLRKSDLALSIYNKIISPWSGFSIDLFSDIVVQGIWYQPPRMANWSCGTVTARTKSMPYLCGHHGSWPVPMPLRAVLSPAGVSTTFAPFTGKLIIFTKIY